MQMQAERISEIGSVMPLVVAQLLRMQNLHAF
jgi:hypothetical protein